MYNTDIYDKKLTDLSFEYKINREFVLSDIKNRSHQDNGLWDIQLQTNGVLKLIPLFNCDSISSSNPNDNVLDKNKCVICIDDDNTIIKCTCVHDDTNLEKGLNLYSWIINTEFINGKLKVFCAVYNDYNHLMQNTSLDVYLNNVLKDTIITGNDGIAEYIVKTNCTIQFKKDNTSSETITIGA